MLSKNTQHQTDLPDQPDFIELLSRLDRVNQEQIDLLRSSLPADNQGTFDKAPDADKLILVLLASLSDNELITLINLERERCKLVGLHEVGEHIHSLALLTGDKRYGDIVHGRVD